MQEAAKKTYNTIKALGYGGFEAFFSKDGAKVGE